MKVKFTKMHASGNDFIFLEHCNIDQHKIRLLSDRRFGIGCDQLIIINQTNIANNLQTIDVSIYNNDGTQAKMCGNAMRCIAGLYCQDGQRISVNIQSGSTVEVLRKQNTAEIAMPTPIIDIPNCMVNVGNLHKIILINQDDEIDVNPSTDFNKNYVRLIGNDAIFVTTIERGAGKTLACGSGIYASSYFLTKINLLHSDMIKISTPGTELECIYYNTKNDLSCKIQDERIYLCGNWHFVCTGEMSL